MKPDTNKPDWLEELEHTADAGIVVTATDLPALFARAAWGMFSIITDVPTVQPRIRTSFSAAAADQPALMVRWLSELNLRHITQHQLFSRFDVISLSDRQITAEISGEPFDPQRHTIHTEIKAVTFHELRLQQEHGSWKAYIIFDL